MPSWVVIILLRPPHHTLKREGKSVWIIKAVFQPWMATAMMFGGFGWSTVALCTSTEGWGGYGWDIAFIHVPWRNIAWESPSELMGLCTSRQNKGAAPAELLIGSGFCLGPMDWWYFFSKVWILCCNQVWGFCGLQQFCHCDTKISLWWKWG